MHLNREDMLRELELLPMWRVRMPPVLDLAGETVAPVVAVPDQVLVAEVPADTAVEAQFVADNAEAAPLPEAVMPSLMPEVSSANEQAAQASWQPERHASAQKLPLADDHFEQDEALPVVSTPAAPVEPVAVDVAPLVQSPWLLYIPAPGHAAGVQLLQNILQALQLPVGEASVQHTPLQRQQVSSRFCVLFGLAAANQFLGAEYENIAAVRGQLHAEGDLCYVITHDLESMLQTPLLKREVWQDLCLLLAKKNEVTA
jgi:uracil-DNA glycosylase